VNELKLLKRCIDLIRVTRRDRDGGEQIALKKERVSLRGVYVFCVNLTVIKQWQALRLHCLKGQVNARDSML